MLTIGIYFLRLSGQGMMSHLYTTAMTRRYEAERGRALSVAIFGQPVSEFLMPLFVFALLAIMPWRQVWQMTSLLVIIVMIPAALFLSGRSLGQDGGGVESLPTGRDGLHWTRGQVLHDIRFWMLSGLVLAPGFTGTGLFFHQIYFVETKGIPLAQWVAGYAFFSTFSIMGSFTGGYLVDKLTALRIAPITVSLLSIAVASLYVTGPGNGVFAYFTIFGIAQGLVHSVANPVWAEIYGTKHLGGIKAITQSMVVFASALSPVILGLMIDAEWSLLVLLLVLGSVPIVAGILSYFAVRMPPYRIT
jgi:MFS family permease